MIAHIIVVSFCIFSLLKYDWIFGKNLKDDTYVLKLSPWPSTLREFCSMLGSQKFMLVFM